MDDAKGKPERHLLKSLGPFAFLVILSVAVLVGFYFNSQAQPGKETANFKDQPPQYLNVYVSNPNVSVELIILLQPDSPTPNIQSVDSKIEAEVSIKLGQPVSSRALHHTKILFTSSLQGNFMSFPRVPVAGIDPNYRLANQTFMTDATLSDLTKKAVSSNGVLIATFTLPSVLEQANGSIFGHLPAVGVGDLSPPIGTSFPYGGTGGSIFPDILAEEWPGSGRIRDISSFRPNSLTVFNIDEHPTPHGGPAELFWTPKNFSATEILSGASLVLRNNLINYVTPAYATEGGNYVWHSGGKLEPAFKMTNPDAADSQSRAAFRSGIALGVAGAAAIALVQELVKDESGIRRRRRSAD